MIVNRRWAGAMLAAGAALSLAAGLAPAQGASVSGWRIVDLFGAPAPNIQAIAASGQDDAWVAGTASDLSLMVEHWNGTAWQPVKPPARFAGSGSADVSALATSGPGNTWVFPDDTQNNAQYALRWDGKSWASFKLSNTNTVLAAATFSSTDAWAWGATGGPEPSGGFGPAWVRRWNGTAWKPAAALPGTPVDVDAVAPNDIWALGPSAATVGSPVQTIIAMHWNGSAWAAVNLPQYPPVAGSPWVPNAVVATGPSNVWVEDSVSVNRGTGVGPAGVIVSHWNGATWTTVVKNLKRWCWGLTLDGHGGFWFVSSNPAHYYTNAILDYRHGHWTSQPAPTETGYYGSAGTIAAVPGTTSFWATGGLASKPTGASEESDILQYRP